MKCSFYKLNSRLKSPFNLEIVKFYEFQVVGTNSSFVVNHVWTLHSFPDSFVYERNWVLATNLNVLIPKSLQSDGVNLWFLITTIWYNRIHSFKYLRSTTSDRNDIGVRKSEFLGKTQFLYWPIGSTLKFHNHLWPLGLLY